MDSSHSLLIPVLASIIFLVCLISIWKYHPSYGRNVGPPIFPIIGSLPSIIKNRYRLYDWVYDELKRSPSFTIRMRVGSAISVMTAHPDNVEHILKAKFNLYPKGENFRENLYDLLGNGIFNVDGDLWKFQRKVASHEFTTNSLRDFVWEKAVAEIQNRLCPVLSEFCENGKIVDLQDLFLQFSFDTICQLSLGVDPCCLNATQEFANEAPAGSVKEGQHFGQAFDTATLLSAQRFLDMPTLCRIKKIFKLGNERKLRDSINVVHRYAMSIIQKRKEQLRQEDGSGKYDDLLSRFMCHTNLSDFMLRDIIISFILAGRDTTASGLTFFFWHLSRSPEAEAAICEELERIRKEREVDSTASAVHEGMFTFDELKKMHYLHAALTESMRLHPPIPTDFKYAVAKDTLPDGTHIPKGCQMVYHTYSMGRMENLWGEDCMKFRPERWLRDGVFVSESPYKYPVFQAGPRICLGKDFAYIQMKLVVASLVQQFKFSVSTQHRLQYTFGISLHLANGLPVSVRIRTSM
eukprot:c23978_g1_i1 orf=301-1866(-)